MSPTTLHAQSSRFHHAPPCARRYASSALKRSAVRFGAFAVAAVSKSARLLLNAASAWVLRSCSWLSQGTTHCRIPASAPSIATMEPTTTGRFLLLATLSAIAIFAPPSKRTGKLRRRRLDTWPSNVCYVTAALHRAYARNGDAGREPRSRPASLRSVDRCAIRCPARGGRAARA